MHCQGRLTTSPFTPGPSTVMLPGSTQILSVARKRECDHHRDGSTMKRFFALVLVLCTVRPCAAVSQQSGGRFRPSLQIGALSATDYHAPLSPFGRSLGTSLSLGVSRAPGLALISPRVGLSWSTANASDSRIHTFRLDAGAVAAPWRRPGSFVPFVALDVGGHLARYDVCSVPVLVDPVGPSGTGCRGSGVGFGWQAGIGGMLSTVRGPSPLVEFRYVASHEGFDGLAFLVGAYF